MNQIIIHLLIICLDSVRNYDTKNGTLQIKLVFFVTLISQEC